MKSINKFLVFALLLIGVTSCAVTDVDRTVDFSKYKTFSWGSSDIKVNNPKYNSDLINRNIKRTVETELASRGISLNQSNPDFVISYHTYTEQKQRTSGGYYGYPYGPFGFYPYAFRYGWGWGFPYSYGYGYGYGPSSYTYTEGTLIIDITDAKSNELIWRGMVSGNVNNVNSLQKQIAKGIKAIIKKYPATPQQSLQLPKDHVS
jgi:hypothetical protein